MLNENDLNKIKVFRSIFNAIDRIRATELMGDMILTTFKEMSEQIFEPAHEFESKFHVPGPRVNVKAGRLKSLQSGRWPFGMPLGYSRKTIEKRDSIIVQNKDSLYVKAAFLWRQSENLSSTEIARRLANLGCSKRKHAIDCMLRNPIYAGILEHKGEKYKASFEPIVSENIFYSIQRDRRPFNYREAHERKFPLNGLVKFQLVSSMSGYIRPKGKIIYAYYKNDSRNSRERINIKASELHELFYKFCMAHIKTKEIGFTSFLRDIHMKYNTCIEAMIEYMITQSALTNSLLKEVQDLKISDNSNLIGRIKQRLLDAELQIKYWIEFSNVDFFVSYGSQIIEKDWQLQEHDMKKEFQKLWFPNGVNFDHISRTFSKI